MQTIAGNRSQGRVRQVISACNASRYGLAADEAELTTVYFNGSVRQSPGRRLYPLPAVPRRSELSSCCFPSQEN